MPLLYRARRAAYGLTYEGRRWRAHMRSLALDPCAADLPIAVPSASDFIACGSPRSGTMLLAAVLWQPPQVVCVAEPWDGLRLLPADLFASLRVEMQDTGRVARGRLDVSALGSDGAVRWRPEGESSPVLVTPETVVGVKWPAFWRYLDLLPKTKFLVCLRHPYDTVASYAATGGRLALGLDYDVPFNREMNARLLATRRDIAARRVKLYDYIYSRILTHLSRPNVMAIRYERWFIDPHVLIAEIARFLGVELTLNVKLRTPATLGSVDREVKDLVRRHCSTAVALGYELF